MYIPNKCFLAIPQSALVTTYWYVLFIALRIYSPFGKGRSALKASGSKRSARRARDLHF
jgi:hypothetical protein